MGSTAARGWASPAFPSISAGGNDFNAPIPPLGPLDGVWHQYVVSFNGTAASYYQDQTFLATQTNTYATTCPAPIRFFGALPSQGYTYYAAGSIDEVCVFNASLPVVCPVLPGTFCLLSNFTSILCSAGTWSNTWALSCANCTPGTYSNAGASLCSPCPNGSFSSRAGAANCTPCAAGTYTSTTGSTSCQQCPGGHYCPTGTSSWARLNCGRGSYCPDGSGAPTPCPYQVPPTGGWGALQVQGPAFLVETARCLNHCFWNFTSGDGMLSKC